MRYRMNVGEAWVPRTPAQVQLAETGARHHTWARWTVAALGVCGVMLALARCCLR